MQLFEPILLYLLTQLALWWGLSGFSLRTRYLVTCFTAAALALLAVAVTLPSQSRMTVSNGLDSFLVEDRVARDSDNGYVREAVATRWLFPLPHLAGHVFARAKEGDHLVVKLRQDHALEISAVASDGRESTLLCADASTWGVPVHTARPARRSCS